MVCHLPKDLMQIKRSQDGQIPTKAVTSDVQAWNDVLGEKGSDNHDQQLNQAVAALSITITFITTIITIITTFITTITTTIITIIIIGIVIRDF